jgi:hypothetical protein
MAGITIPIEIEVTPRSKAIMDALYKAIGPQFQAPDEPAQPATTPTLNLQPDEHYAGIVLDADGNTLHHLVLMADRPTDDLNWQAAMDWAKRVGGDLPTRQEQALLFANCKPHIKPEWHWSNQTHEDEPSSAWGCYFSDGSQGNSRKSYGGCAVAVRRVL